MRDGDVSLVRRAVNAGLIGGAAAIYFAVVGMIQRFDARVVIYQVVTLGPGLLFVVYFITGFLAGRPPAVRHGEEPPPPPSAASTVGRGALAGGIAGALTAALLLLGSAIDMRSVLVSMTQPLLDILSFDQGAGLGSLVEVLVGGVIGLLGAALHLLPSAIRRAVIVGLSALALVSLMEPLLGQVMRNIFASTRFLLFDPTWLYRGGGLTRVGAIIVFVLAAGISFFWATRKEVIRGRVGALPAPQRQAGKLVAFFLLAALLFILPEILGSFLSEVIGTVGLYVLLGLGLNIVVGYAGLLDLGYVAFFAVGAYATAILTSPAAFTEGPFNFWTALPLVVLITAVSGIAIGAPVLRLRGDYLAIVTLGFGEIVRIIAISNWARPWTGGAQGILRVPDPSIGVELPFIGGPELNGPESLYYLIVIACIAAAFISVRLQDSRVGRAWVAMREDEQVAEAMGISIIKTKLLAFVMGATIGSFSGMFFAVKIGSIFPHSFALLVSIAVLSIVVLGGMGSIPGVVAGAFVLIGLPELLREFAEYRLLIYGAILVGIMLFKPEGLIPSARRQLELHEEQYEEEQYEMRRGPSDEGAPVVAAGGGGDPT